MQRVWLKKKPNFWAQTTIYVVEFSGEQIDRACGDPHQVFTFPRFVAIATTHSPGRVRSKTCLYSSRTNYVLLMTWLWIITPFVYLLMSPMGRTTLTYVLKPLCPYTAVLTPLNASPVWWEFGRRRRDRLCNEVERRWITPMAENPDGDPGCIFDSPNHRQYWLCSLSHDNLVLHQIT